MAAPCMSNEVLEPNVLGKAFLTCSPGLKKLYYE